jgi:hypothetical protein
MVSMVETSHTNHNDMALDQVAKSEPLAEGSISSAVSTPDPEAEILMTQEAQSQNIQKRKGGRKPVSHHCIFIWGGFISLYTLFSEYLLSPYLFNFFKFSLFSFVGGLIYLVFFLSLPLFGPGPRITFLSIYHSY